MKKSILVTKESYLLQLCKAVVKHDLNLSKSALITIFKVCRQGEQGEFGLLAFNQTAEKAVYTYQLFKTQEAAEAAKSVFDAE